MTQRSESSNGSALKFRLGNADFTVERVLSPVDKLQLDPGNQRLAFLLRKRKHGAPVSDEELHKLLWEMDSVKALFQSILQNGGLLEDPVARTDGKVVEGNCRTVALREIRKKYPDDERFENVYVRILPTDVTDEQISLLLGELHIAGKIEWRAFDQAEYVWRMNKVFAKTYDFLATHLRWSRSKLSQKIAAYEETKNYLEHNDDPQGINRFSHFEEFMKKKPLRDRREQETDFMGQFGEWIFDGKLPDSKDVRMLPAILENTEALAKLEDEGIRAARQVLERTNPSISSNLYGTIDQMVSELESISLQEITALQKGDAPRVEKFGRLAKALQRIEEISGVQFPVAD